MSKVEIVEISSKYMPEMIEALQETNAFHYDGCPTYFMKPNKDNDSAYLRWIMSTSDNFGYLALVNGKLAGMILCGLVVKNNCYKKVYYIHDLVVKSEYRSLGIGKYLCNKLTEQAKKNGIKHIEGEVFMFNENAIGFYKKLGYKTASTVMSLDL